MITQYDIYPLVVEKIPQLGQLDFPYRGSLMVYAAISHFADYTRHAIEKRDVGRMKICFSLAEDFYLHGDNLVRLLIAQSFIYSLAPYNAMCPADKLLIKSIIPQTMFAVYTRQAKQGH